MTQEPETGPEPVGWVLERARAVSGIFTAGLLVLAVSLIVIWVVASAAGEPGPGPAMLVGHAVAAAAAVLLHRLGRVRTDRAGYLAVLGPPAILLLLGFLFWWN